MASGFSKKHSKILLFWGLAVLTVVYVILLWVRFFNQFPPGLSDNFHWFWRVCLLGYVVLKEIFRWSNEKDLMGGWGELFVGLVIGAYVVMELWKAIALWTWGCHFEVPIEAFHGSLEALALWIGSLFSALWCHVRSNNKNNKNDS